MFKVLFGSGILPSKEKERTDAPRASVDEDATAPPLHSAIRRRELKEAKKLIDRSGEAAVLATDKKGRTAYHVVAETGVRDALKLLTAVTRKPAEAVSQKDRLGCTPAFYACLRGDKKLVKDLMVMGSDPAAVNLVKESLLHAPFRAPFMAKQHVSTVRELLSLRKVPLNALNDELQTPLQIACNKGAYDIAVALLEAGADATLVKAGDPPLFWAVVNDNSALVRQLLQHGADISQPNGKGQALMEFINPKSEIYRIIKKHALARPGGARKLGLLSEQIVVATTVAQLPADMAAVVKSSFLYNKDLDANWQLFCNIMQLVMKRRIAASAEEAAQIIDRKAKKNKEEQTQAVSAEVDSLTCRLITLGDPRQVFKKLRVAGQGGFGMVFQGTGPDKKQWAIKRMPHSSEKEKLANLREANFLKRCQHKNICGYKATYECVADHELYLIMELLEGGTLDESIGVRQSRHKFEEKHLSYTAREVLQAIHYLHSENIVHRDLKSENIMFTLSGEIKIIDFGLAISVADDAPQHNETVGSPYWMPPEMILRKPHGPPADIWSMGVCVIELANHRPPDNSSVLRHLFMVATGNVPSLDHPERWSSHMRNFIDQCMKFDPTQRARALVLLQHPWLAKSCAKADMAVLLRSVFLVRDYDETAL